MRKVLILFLFLPIALTSAARAQTNADTVLVLPFENVSGKPEFNWVGESFADALTDLLKVPGLNVVPNAQRKITQLRLKVPLSNLPSLATALKLARESNATLLITGKYDIKAAQGDTAASINLTSKIIRVQEGRFFSEEMPDGRRLTRDINLIDALANLQTVQGQLAYQILYQRDKALPFSQNQFIETANKVPARAFEAYIKGLLIAETGDGQARENFFKNAMRLYAEAKPNEVYADAALELGHYYLNKRDNQNAVDYFSRVSNEIQRCREEAEKDKKFAQCNDAIYAEATFYTTLIYWQQERYEQALAVLRPLAEDLKLTSVYNTLGAIAVQASRAEKKNKGNSEKLLQEGLDYLKKAAESAPEEGAPRFNYGLALFLNNNFKDAAEQFRPILASNPRDGESFYLLAKSLEKMGDATSADYDNQARRFLTNYAKIETDWQKAQTTDGLNLRVQQPARRDFVSVILTKGANANQIQTPVNETEALLTQAHDLYKAGQDDESMQILRRVLAAEPNSAQAYLLLGNIHLRRGDLEQAVNSLRTSLFWNSSLIEAHIALGKIYLERKDCLQAKNHAESALKIDENNEEALGLQRSVERCSK